MTGQGEKGDGVVLAGQGADNSVAPSDDERVLKRRAAKLARTKEDALARTVAHRIALVACGKERFGIPVDGLREFVSVPAIASLPGLPAWMPGLAHVRGDLLSVVDLARWLAIENAETPTSLAVLEADEGPVGLLVGEVLGFRDVYQDDLVEDFDAARHQAGRLVREITRDLVAIIDLERLLGDKRLIVSSSHKPEAQTEQSDRRQE